MTGLERLTRRVAQAFHSTAKNRMERSSDMSTQTDQRSLSVKPGEQQAQSSQRKEMARSSPRSGFLQRRGGYSFGRGPPEFFPANPLSLFLRVTQEKEPGVQEVGLERARSDKTGL